MKRIALLAIGVIAFTAVPHAQERAAIPAPPPPSSTVPRSVPFTGQLLTPAGDARTGSVMLTFGLYADQQGGTPIWTEQQLVALDAGGRYSVILGSMSTDGLPADAFAAGTPRWLGVQAEGEKEQPRFMLLSVPYALKAGDADTVAGKAAADFVLSSHLFDSVKSAMKDTDPNAPLVTPNALVKYQNSGGALTESSTVDVGGKLGVQVAAPIGELDIAGFGSSTTVTLRNGGSAADVVKLVGADGSLRIGSATDANLINLIGSNVGIGTTTPSSKVEIAGGDGLRIAGFEPFITLRDGSLNSYIQGLAGSLVFKPSSGDAQAMVLETGTGRLAIRTLDIRTPTATSGIPAIWVVNSNGDAAFAVLDHGAVYVRNYVSSQGTLHVCRSGNYLADCGSAAEYVPTIATDWSYPEAADLVTIADANPYGDEHAPFGVAKSTTACDPNLIGFLLDPASGADGTKVNDHYLPLAIYGYFPAKVTIDNGAIRRGDPITSSSKPGVGMKSTGACRIIGYALEDADADGTIQVFAHLTESTAAVAAPLQTEVAALRRENVELQTRLGRVEQALAAILANQSGAVPR